VCSYCDWQVIKASLHHTSTFQTWWLLIVSYVEKKNMATAKPSITRFQNVSPQTNGWHHDNYNNTPVVVCVARENKTETFNIVTLIRDRLLRRVDVVLTSWTFLQCGFGKEELLWMCVNSTHLSASDQNPSFTERFNFHPILKERHFHPIS